MVAPQFSQKGDSKSFMGHMQGSPPQNGQGFNPFALNLPFFYHRRVGLARLFLHQSCDCFCQLGPFPPRKRVAPEVGLEFTLAYEGKSRSYRLNPPFTYEKIPLLPCFFAPIL